MKTYIVLLRAVNVGGRFMKMEALRDMCEGLGCSSVQTYVQSGNVILKSKLSPVALKKKLEGQIPKIFKYNVSVIVLSPEKVKKVLKGMEKPS